MSSQHGCVFRVGCIEEQVGSSPYGERPILDAHDGRLPPSTSNVERLPGYVLGNNR